MTNFLLGSLKLRPKKVSPEAECIANFLSLPEHYWIKSNDLLFARFIELFSFLPASDLKEILVKRRLLLLYCNQKMSCAFHQFRNREIVLVFPELLRLMESAKYLEAYSILAHEMGHIVLGHSRNEIHPRKAQLEADRYAAELGLGEELFRVLQVETPTAEIRERLSALKLLFSRQFT